MALRIVFEWLGGCSGCEISVLNMGEDLLPLLAEHFDVVHAPVLMDHKYYGQLGEGQELRLPKAEVGIVTGSVANEEHLEVLLEMRSKCDILIALGTCATHGGIPALMNEYKLADGLEEIFHTESTDAGSTRPGQGVPAPLERVFACDEKVKIDLFLPGCGPQPAHIKEVLTALVEQRSPKLPKKSVCDTCPTIRKGKGEVSIVRRFLVNADYKEKEPIDSMRCLLEQGFLCMGPVTAAGCGMDGCPSCIRARVPCRGCHGPVRQGGNQLLDMMNAFASNGVEYKTVVDRRGMLRFSGGHGLLRAVKKR